jgi:hypothetical protein
MPQEFSKEGIHQPAELPPSESAGLIDGRIDSGELRYPIKPH